MAEDFRGKRILDVGCGSGRYSVEFARRGAAQVVGVDFAPAMVRLAEALAKAGGVHQACQFRIGDFCELDFQDQFDMSVAIGLFDYVQNPVPILTKMRQVTRGKVIASFPRRWSFKTLPRKLWLTARGCPVYFYSAGHLRKSLQASGLTDVRIERLSGTFLVIASIGPEIEP
jgi:ubiquinone/menaquinone biosynthesis C-methylase UbiE